jgi:RNA polymerase sigma factor (sigma-70 family)
MPTTNPPPTLTTNTLDNAPSSWEEIVRMHSAKVYRLAYRLTGNQHDAEDLTQDVFVRVFRRLSTYTPGTFDGWLHRITTNLFLDQVRRNERARLAAVPSEWPARREPAPADVVDGHALPCDVQAALDTLPAAFRVAVVLCDIEGLTHQEIATTLNIKLGTVRSRLHRGRVQLRHELAHRAPALVNDYQASDLPMAERVA